MKYKSPIITQGSGSVGGATYSRNKGGNYIRARAVPTNPNSPQQQEVRGAMAQLAARWQTLTAPQRAGWTTYAANVLLPNPLGDLVNIGAVGQYMRSNIPRIQAALAIVDAAPTTFDLGEFTDPVVGTIDASDGDLELAFTNTDDWAAEVGSAMLVYVSRPQNVSIDFFKGPYRFAETIPGAASPPTSPATITLPFSVAAGNKVFVMARVSRADGRLSATFRGAGLATA